MHRLTFDRFRAVAQGLQKLQAQDNQRLAVIAMHDIRQPSDLPNLPFIHDDTLPSCTSTSVAVLQAAMDGGGIALARSLLVSDDPKSGRLVRLFPDISIPSPLAYYLVVPRRKLQFASGVCV